MLIVIIFKGDIYHGWLNDDKEEDDDDYFQREDTNRVLNIEQLHCYDFPLFKIIRIPAIAVSKPYPDSKLCHTIPKLKIQRW